MYSMPVRFGTTSASLWTTTVSKPFGAISRAILATSAEGQETRILGGIRFPSWTTNQYVPAQAAPRNMPCRILALRGEPPHRHAPGNAIEDGHFSPARRGIVKTNTSSGQRRESL